MCGGFFLCVFYCIIDEHSIAMQPYDHKQIEQKWQKIWAKNKVGEAKDPKKGAGKKAANAKKFYSLIEFPYPSGDGLHVGHIRSNTAMDIISHKRRREGYDVLYPIGWDAFGLPTENYAIKTGIQPAVVTKKNTDTFRRQLKSLGFFFDWSREINTTDPKYYKWTQWIFLQFLKEGLAYKKKMTINWCPKDLIGLANEEVIDGKCERCGTPVEKREKEQWMLAITKYADKLLAGLDAVECAEPKFVDHVNPPRPDKRTVERNNVHAIVFDPKTKKYLIIRNKKHGWDTVVIGGIEENENPVEAGRREVREETGYTDIEFKRILGGPVEASYFAKHKDQNRIAHARAVYFELKSDARVPITDDNGEGNEIIWVDESDFVPGKMVNSELPVWLARMSVRVERDEKDSNVLRFIDVSSLSGFREGVETVERNPIAAIVKHWKEDKYIGLKWKKVAWKTIITGGPEGNQTPEEGAATEIIEETGYLHPKFVRNLGRVDSKFFHNPKNINRLAHFDVMYFELKDGKQRELTEEEKANHDVVWLTKEEMSAFISPAAQKYMWDTMFLGKPSWFDEPRPLLDWPESIKESQRNWIGKSEGAEFDFVLSARSKKYKYVLLHGYKAKPSDPLYPWLKEKLEEKGHAVLIPALPNPGKPVEEEQVAAALAAMEKIGYDENTILYGHSLGTVVAMKVVEKLQRKIAGLVLAGGFADVKFKDHPRPFEKTFNWKFDASKIKNNVGFIKLLHDIKDIAVDEGQAFRLGELLQTPVQKVIAEEPHFDGNTEPTILKALTPSVTVFTTRPDTLFGVTYVVLAPEHPWARIVLPQLENKKEVGDYVAKAKNQTDIVRTDAKREKTGVELKGLSAINPANGEKVPVWIADYVLSDYGTGAVMAVPAHDERDFEFAKKHGLPVRQVIAPYRENTTDLIPKKDKPIIRRENIHAIIRHPKENKYLFITWKKEGWNSFVTGGIEKGEDIVAAGRREILEETGYKNLKHIPTSGSAQQVHSFFYAPHKNENRYMITRGVVFQLENEERAETSDEEKSKHDLVWIDENKAREFLTHINQKWIWDYCMNDHAYAGEGILINSGSFDGQKSETVKKEIAAAFGTPKTTYKLRDWVFSRQRYWGEPIPVIHCPECGIVPVPEKDLPVKLPEVKNYKPTETGESPLAAISGWVNVKCPKCGSKKQAQKNKYFIFDFDGVLGDTWKAAINAHVAMGSPSKEEAENRMLKYFDRKPNHARDVQRTPEKIQSDLDFIRKFGKCVVDSEPQLFKDFIKEVKKHKNAKCAVVSSGSQAYVLPMLEGSGLKFSHILAYEDHASKEEKIEWVCKDWNVGVRDIHYFTDTKADVYELENLLDRSKIVGCAWGYHGFEKLREALPENQILKNFKDMHAFFENAGMAKRETDTMPNWAGSSWYYLRYTDPHNAKAFAAADKLKYWTPVDWYNGGNEHTTLHLLYSRFWHKFLFDQGLVPTSEPYTKRTSHGLILAKGGEKMSKSKGNVINPDGIVEAVGADSLRLYEMFMGPFDQAIAWDENGIVGCRRFIERVWKLAEKVNDETPAATESDTIVHKTIKKVSEDIEAMRFNTAVSALMIAVNELEKIAEKSNGISRENYAAILSLLAPFAPHVTEELWQKLNLGKGKFAKSIHQAPWPAFDPSKIAEATVRIAVQVNGKTRSSFEMPSEEERQMSEQGAREKAVALDEIKKWIYGKEIKKVIYVKGRLINIVIASTDI